MRELSEPEMLEMYESNNDLKEYVEKYKQRDNITADEALKHALVKEKAKDILYRLNN